MFNSVAKSFAFSRIFVFLSGALGYYFLTPVHEGISVPLQEPAPWYLSIWYQWDANWYMSIVYHGYPWTGNEQSNVVFFPLYPLVTWMLGAILDSRFLVAGIIVSLAALLGAMLYLYKLVKIDYGGKIASRAVLLLGIFPTSFFFSTFYTESLFMMTSMAAFYYGRRGRWALAGLWGFLASLTRVTGLLLLIPLAYEFASQHSFSLKKIARPAALWLLLIPAGVGAYMLYLYLSIQQPLAFAQMQQSGWGHEFTWFVGSITRDLSLLIDQSELWVLYEFAATAGLVVLTIYGFKKLRASYSLYMLLSLLFFLAEGTTKSISRYMMMAFPIFILLPMLAGKRPVWLALCAVSLALLGISTAFFVSGRWIA